MNLSGASQSKLSARDAAGWTKLWASALHPWRQSTAAGTAQPMAISCRRGVLRRSRGRGGLTATARAGLTSGELTASRDEDYNERMAQQMGWDANPYEYHYDRGLYYHEILPGLICGTQPRNASDLDYLHFSEHVDVILNMQQNEDFRYWNVDFHSIYHRGVDTHGMEVVRRPAVDFDPHSLRKVLPAAVQVVAEALAAGKKVYVHCTAGLGRAPAVCIAYLYWFTDRQLDTAYEHLTTIRPCGPKKDAIRGATFDLLDGRPFEEFAKLPSDAYAYLNADDRAAAQTAVLRWE